MHFPRKSVSSWEQVCPPLLLWSFCTVPERVTHSKPIRQPDTEPTDLVCFGIPSHLLLTPLISTHMASTWHPPLSSSWCLLGSVPSSSQHQGRGEAGLHWGSQPSTSSSFHLCCTMAPTSFFKTEKAIFRARKARNSYQSKQLPGFLLYLSSLLTPGYLGLMFEVVSFGFGFLSFLLCLGRDFR